MKRLTTAIAATALLTLAACGGSTEATSGGRWNFTDGRDEKISLDAAPKTIVAQSSMAAALKDLGVKGVVGVFGPLRGAGGGVDRQADGLDPGAVEDVTGGGDYGSLDLEKLASLSPDIVATYQYLPKQLWYVSPAMQVKVEKLAPTVVLDFEDKTLVETLVATEKLAEALGADLDSDKVREGHEDFDAASDRLKAIAKKLGDKKIIATSPAPDTFYVSDPNKSPDLSYYVDELGLPIVEPTGLKKSDYFEAVSWENADKYGGDIALYDARVGKEGLRIYDKQPVWQQVPAGKNRAYVPWQSVAPPSFAAYAKSMNEIADGLESQL